MLLEAVSACRASERPRRHEDGGGALLSRPIPRGFPQPPAGRSARPPSHMPTPAGLRGPLRHGHMESRAGARGAAPREGAPPLPRAPSRAGHGAAGGPYAFPGVLGAATADGPALTRGPRAPSRPGSRPVRAHALRRASTPSRHPRKSRLRLDWRGCRRGPPGRAFVKGLTRSGRRAARQTTVATRVND